MKGLCQILNKNWFCYTYRPMQYTCITEVAWNGWYVCHCGTFFFETVSLVECMYPVLITCQVELLQVIRVSVLLCARCMCDVNCSSAVNFLCLLTSDS